MKKLIIYQYMFFHDRQKPKRNLSHYDKTFGG